MSYSSDDTDVLLLVPPDIFAVPDVVSESPCCSEGNLLAHIHYLEDKLRKLETDVLMNSMRRFGSVEALTTTSRAQYHPRSLQSTPLKLKNMLECEPYVSQKYRDDEKLRDIEEYFRNRQVHNSPIKQLSLEKKIELSEVKNLLLEVEQTQKAVLEKLAFGDSNGDASRNDECNSRQIGSARRALSFDSPNTAPTDTVRERTYAIGDLVEKQNFTSTDPSSDIDSTEKCSLASLYPENSRQTPYEQLQVLNKRLEEERCRRQHCEGRIRSLQKNLLELEEKLAVALNSDRDKDMAIGKLREGWDKIMEHCKNVEDQHKNFTERFNEEKQKFTEEKETLISSVKRYEVELSKALDLAHGYKEKCESAMKDQKISVREKESMKLELDKILDQLHFSEEAALKLNGTIAEKEEALNQCRAKVSEGAAQVRELKKQLKLSLIDKERLQHEKNAKLSLQNKFDEALKRELQAQEQIRSLTKQKTDLKQYYQGQVEKIVDEKQKEFQEQLFTAEKTLQKQLASKEQAVEELARMQIQQLSEKHKIEIALLEEKHCQEIKLCEIRLTQSNQKIEDLQKVIAEHACHQQELAERLHGLMETQWKETLKAISSSSSFNQNTENCELPTLSRQNTFTLSDDKRISNGESSREPVNCRKRGSMTYRIDETPQKISSESKLKGYIDQLLQQHSFETNESVTTAYLDPVIDCNRASNTAESSTVSKDSMHFPASSKPPWKG